MTELVERWQLELGEPYPPGAAGHAFRATLPDGTPAVLKISTPHREAEQEADALERWNGDGAVRLLARDDERHALLLERCEPGSFLSESPDALDVLIGLLPRLWKNADGFHTLTDEVAHWALEGDVGSLAGDLAATQGELVLVHQDLHGENVLAAEREPWLVIDPKPLAAEREFAVAPIARSSELGHSKRDVLYRLDRLCGELGLDHERARGWTIVQTVAWGGERAEDRSEVVEWLS
ncbi:MAG TPA: aminoglycoside phosphotransferase family protein [Gaiellaceae bacterium]|nr:aminoglycoside phosphotransferase family protein [Gaiellaceae bacterium]